MEAIVLCGIQSATKRLVVKPLVTGDGTRAVHGVASFGKVSPVSAENVEALRRLYAEMARGNFWPVGEILDPEIVWEWAPSLSGLTGVAAYHGIGGVEAATLDFLKVWDRFSQEAEEIIDAGDNVLVITRTRARLEGSEQELEGRAAELWTFRGGKAVRFRGFDSVAEARAAAGLPHEPAAG